LKLCIYLINSIGKLKIGNNSVSNFSSSDTSEFLKKWEEEDFYDWFRGFCDAESNFLVRVRKKNETIQGFEFIFRIALHKDDLNVLTVIQNKLNCGRIRSERNTYIIYVSSLIDIETIIIPRFDKWPLMTKKYLDFLDFKRIELLFYYWTGNIYQNMENY